MSDEILDPEVAHQIVQALERLADGTVCVQCGADVAHFRQVVRSYYADPCGHRQGQDRAEAFNAKIAAKWALQGT